MSSRQLVLADLQLSPVHVKKLEQFLLRKTGETFNKQIENVVNKYLQMINELQYMEQTLPELLQELRGVKGKVDKRRKRSNYATLGGSSASLLGGAMILGGIVAAPFTLGATLGLTIAGTAVTIGGAATTSTAKTYDFLSSYGDQKRTNAKVNEFLGHYTAAKEAYEEIEQVCRELAAAAFPTLSEAQKKQGFYMLLHAIATVPGALQDVTAAPRSYVSAGLNSTKIVRAAMAPKTFHSTVKLALAPAKGLTASRQFVSNAVFAAKSASSLDSSGFKMAIVASFQSAGVMISVAGTVLTIGGMLLDAWSIYGAGKELLKKQDCKVSQNIGKHINELENLGDGLRKLNREIAANVRTITE